MVKVKSKKAKVKRLLKERPFRLLTPDFGLRTSDSGLLTFILCFMSFILCLSTPSFSQSKSDCLKKVIDFNKKMKQITTSNGSQVCFFHYISHTAFWEAGNQAPETSEIKMWVGKQQMHFLTKDVEVYQDTKDAFMIIHSRKMVVWATSTAEQEKKERLKLINKGIDTLITTSTVLSCENITQEGKKVQKIVLALNPQGQGEAKVSQVTYWYDLATGNITRSTLLFTNAREMKSLSHVFKEINLNHPSKMDKPAIELVMKNNKQLLSRYQGYQLIDNRNQN